MEERAQVIITIAQWALALSLMGVLYSVVASTLMPISPTIAGCMLLAYSSYEVSVMANNIKNYFVDGVFSWWHPEKSFAENLGLDKTKSGWYRQVNVQSITHNAPISRLILSFWYR